MKFQPKTEDEVMAAELCPEGKYPFTILECNAAASKSKKNTGKEMFKLKLNVHADDGDYHIYDYIAPWFMEFKFRHFFFCIGRGADYETGEVSPDNYRQKQGWCEVGIQKGNGEFGPKNTITDYVMENEKAKEEPAQPVAQAKAADPESDDVPF